MTDTLIEHLASMNIRKLSSEGLALELDFASRERVLSDNVVSHITASIPSLDFGG